MKKTIYGAMSAAVALALIMSVSDAQALGNACRRVDFRVNNNFPDEITVEKFELYSSSEGRYLNENFQNVSVGQGVQNFLVRHDETVENAENDFIAYIKVTWTHINNSTGAFHRHTTVDYAAEGICRADTSYTATVD